MSCTRCGRDDAGFRRGSRQCKACDKKKRHECRDQIKARMRHYAERYPHRVWASGSYQNHRKKNFTFAFTIAELSELARASKHCAICGCVLRWAYGTKGGRCVPNSPTMDRKNRRRHLRFADVQITCLRCNTSKGARTQAEFLEYCRLVLRQLPQGRREI